MKVLLIGNGGRENAISWSLSNSKSVTEIFIAPGNGGTGNLKKCKNVEIESTDFPRLLTFAKDNAVDLVVVGPEQPLVDGICTLFKKAGIPCFGPSELAARIEGSKSFSKDFMKRHAIPTAAYEKFTNFESAREFVSKSPSKWVIKASGLAAGKGVIIPETLTEAVEGLKSIMVDNIFGTAGTEVVIEERLEGQEVSVLSFTDGYTIVPMPGAQDHKRALDGDLGPNTGGMGAYAPAPVYTVDLQDLVKRTILVPTINGMRRDGPKVLEYNCRFGDPETQVLLPLLDENCDLAQILLACCESRLDSVSVKFKNSFAATVVLASSGYPGSYKKGKSIMFSSKPVENTIIFHAGTNISNGQVVTSGGRVLGVTGVADSLQQALALAYKTVEIVEFEGKQFRKDIGHRAISLLKSKVSAGTTYADAGVSIDDGNLLVEKIKPIVKATRRVGADADIGGFGGVFDLKACGYKDPVLVSGTDGVGTKLKIAHSIGKHDTIGIDLVAMSVNDVLVQGAEPLYFLDYFACSKLEVVVARDVIAGISAGCIDSACALIGGETAEMPGIYAPGDYDLAGFVVGAVEREKILPNLDSILAGDVVLGLASSGIHSNGFSLVRHVITKEGLDLNSACPFETKNGNETLGETLLSPTRIYVRQLLPAIRSGLIKSMAHITGGGFTDNIPRALNKNRGVLLNANSWPLLPVFKWLMRTGKIEPKEMARTFNCGIGMIIIVGKNDVGTVKNLILEAGEKNIYELGVVTERDTNSLEEAVKIVGIENWV
ncbi:hypothetical protein HK099_002639 [Clydaea vesicula]|uniref:ATP-grasp domain-containing protein n=1 Tax=Clydaea vesicula TaxID=447962 RepID=A0AAD5U7C5_9FUNG|nr:hypothetical protein HK099_002639 [Clydaea vesicula]